jgi:osmotically-inducible protein OsmY
VLTAIENAPLEGAVLSSLAADPRIPDSAEIAISADDGEVILRGTVESFRQRRAAAKDAAAVDGVEHIHDELKINLLGSEVREDDQIRGAALQTLIWDGEVPSSVDAKVSEGWVTLKGTVSYQFESDAAFDDVATLYGVLGVTNDIKVITP